MIKRIYIKNFKYWSKENEAQIPLDGNTIFVGENDSGKSSILQALDIFFNEEKIDKAYIPDLESPVEIGVLVEDGFFKKTYSPKTFKESKASDSDWSVIDRLHYIYLGPNFDDPASILKRLGKAQFTARVDEEEITSLETAAQNAIDSVLDGTDQGMVIINRENTEIAATPVIKLEKAIDFNIDDSEGVPISGRGSGFQKNLNYAMLIGNDYSNVILGIDEIENSFSMKNCSDLLVKLSQHVSQLFVTTHSGHVLGNNQNYGVVPLGKEPGASLREILTNLGEGDKPYVLVEGKFDLPWFKKAIELLGYSDQVILLPAGGTNAPLLQNELSKVGVSCFVVYDGDQAGKDLEKCFCLNRECVELYAPEKLLKELYDDLPSIDDKETFFTCAKESGNYENDNAVKSEIADKIADYLDVNDPFVQEVKEIMQIILRQNE